jgi:eukaryotic-like serine/threonine-protein kinase
MSQDRAAEVARWRRAREVFDEVVDFDAAEQAERLTRACGDDLDLRREVESLLFHDRSASQTIELIVAGAAAEVEGGTLADGAAAMPQVVGRYRILRKLGEGGMGEVFLAEDTSLARRIALKVPFGVLSRDPQARLRLQQEARAAATISHPHVCVVHEVGEGPGGHPFIAMEYIDGETLASRIRRGPLPVAEVVELGREAASALHEAHTKGIVHRDLKPSNIMLTAHGVKLLDFGLANAPRHAPSSAMPAAATFAGTIPYMSPEQVRSEEVDHRTDVYSLGVVLYEAATGSRPYDAANPEAICKAILGSEPRAPTQVVADLPAALDRVIGRALAKNREDRYQSAAELGADLVEPAPPAPIAANRTRIADNTLTALRRPKVAVPAAALVTALAVGIFFYSRHAPTLTERDTVLVADFENTTGEPIFDATLRAALEVKLEESPYLSVFADDRVRQALRLMGRQSDDRLTSVVARELCQRQNLKAMISGSIAGRGREYLVALKAVNCATGDSLALTEAVAPAKEAVLKALGIAASGLRNKLGESLASIKKYDTPIEVATTSSLEALKAYSTGEALRHKGADRNAITLLKLAIELDPNFAMAHGRLGTAYSNLMEQGLSDEYTTRAYELRQRTSTLERLYVSIRYYDRVTGDLPSAIETLKLWQQIYPRDWQPRISLGNDYNAVGEREKAIEEFRAAIRLNPDVSFAYGNLMATYLVLGRADEAAAVAEQAIARQRDYSAIHAYLYGLAFVRHDVTAMKTEIEWLRPRDPPTALLLEMNGARFTGRLRELRALVAREVDARSAAGNSKELAAGALLDLADMESRVGNARPAVETVAAALKMSDTRATVGRAAMALARIGAARQAQPLLDRTLNLYPATHTIAQRGLLPSIRAWMELTRGDQTSALGLLNASVGVGEADPGFAGFSYRGIVFAEAAYVRALSFLELGQTADAEREFRMLSDRARYSGSEIYALCRLGLARTAAKAGHVEQSRKAYEQFFALWKDADADLPILVGAREEFARLQ